MIETKNLGVVWNQNKGMVQVFADGGRLLLEMSQDEARSLADHLTSAARIPELAAKMADPQQPETLADIIRREAHAHNEAVYTGVDGATKWHPDQAGNGVAAQGYAE